MGKMIGLFCILGGVAYLLYQWVLEQKSRQRRVEEVVVFLQKTIFAMEEEKIRIIEYFENYASKEILLEESLREIAKRLRQNLYPKGEIVWETVFWEKKEQWNLDADTFDILLGIGMGFFGKKRSENMCFLQRKLRELEKQQGKRKEKDANERKVWIPVGMLGGIMLMIILV